MGSSSPRHNKTLKNNKFCGGATTDSRIQMLNKISTAHAPYLT